MQKSSRRFSLKQVLGWTTVICLILSNVVLAYRLRQAERELKLLRLESGYLIVDQPDKVQLISAPALGKHQWRWRIHAPPGVKFEYGVQFGEVPPSGIPDSQFTQTVTLPSEPNGTLLTLEASRDAEGRMHLALRGADFGFFSPTDRPPKEWLDGSGLVNTAGTLGQETYDIGDPIILRRNRLIKDEEVLRIDEVAELGYIVWLRPVRD